MKFKKFDGVYIAVGVVVLLIGLFLPKSGHMALLDVAFDDILIWAIVVYFAIKVRKFTGGIKENWYLYIMCLGLGVFVVFTTTGLIRDFITGPQVIKLENVKLSKLQGAKGLASMHYYLEGTDIGKNEYKIEISGDEYSNLGTVSTIVVTYYENTNRLYEIGGTR